MAKRLVYIAPLLVFAAIAVFFFAGLGRDPAIVPSALIDKPAPKFNLPALIDGKPGLSSADLKGKPVLVNVFASWCVPCKEEHPILMDLAKEGVVLYGIDYKDKPEDARQLLAAMGDPYERIGADRDGSTGIDWGVYGVPETYVVDSTGTIRYKQVGPLDREAVEGVIRPLLSRLAK
ncbi:MAG TPA: DsbE family thiol:disulfide interchange protein [Alphaproteobacteria bacterium]|nr:DsbE family thiol:disulfide interchange protein [Alphaproteobacteria bacterium]